MWNFSNLGRGLLAPVQHPAAGCTHAVNSADFARLAQQGAAAKHGIPPRNRSAAAHPRKSALSSDAEGSDYVLIQTESELRAQRMPGSWPADTKADQDAERADAHDPITMRSVVV